MDEIDQIAASLQFEVIRSYWSGSVRLDADEAKISAFEATIGHELPVDYRTFLAHWGGASPQDALVPAIGTAEDVDPDEEFSVSSFFGFYSADDSGPNSEDLVEQFNRLSKHLPTGWVPIAKSGDNRFCISCQPNTAGQVFAWLPPEFADDDAKTVLIALSFIEFLRALHPREE